MRKWFNSLLLATRKYTVWDLGFLKLALFSLGLLIGVYFAQFVGQYMTYVWAFFVFSYLWIIYKTLIQYRDR